MVRFQVHKVRSLYCARRVKGNVWTVRLLSLVTTFQSNLSEMLSLCECEWISSKPFRFLRTHIVSSITIFPLTYTI